MSEILPGTLFSKHDDIFHELPDVAFNKSIKNYDSLLIDLIDTPSIHLLLPVPRMAAGAGVNPSCRGDKFPVYRRPSRQFKAASWPPVQVLGLCGGLGLGNRTRSLLSVRFQSLIDAMPCQHKRVFVKYDLVYFQLNY